MGNFIGSWHEITKAIFQYSSEITGDNYGFVISGGDASRRHLNSQLDLKLNAFLLALTGFNLTFLLRSAIYNVDKRIVTPQFNLQQVMRPYHDGINTHKVELVERRNPASINSTNLADTLNPDERDLAWFTDEDGDNPFIDEDGNNPFIDEDSTSPSSPVNGGDCLESKDKMHGESSHKDCNQNGLSVSGIPYEITPLG